MLENDCSDVATSFGETATKISPASAPANFARILSDVRIFEAGGMNDLSQNLR